MTRIAICLLLTVCLSSAEEALSLPEKVKSLKAAYEAAVQRATEPLTKTYVQELQKLKSEYTKAGDLQAAVSVDELLKTLESPDRQTTAAAVGSVPLSRMTVGQFKDWLKGVVISEESGFMNHFTYDGEKLTSKKRDAARVHENVIIKVGELFVPFTSTNATIVIDGSLSKAQVTYSTGEKCAAKITPKTKG